jgi:dolichyl-phosphate beta-glucosyltransferase
VAHDLFGRLRVTSIVFDVDLIHLARRRGYRIAVVPIVWADRRGSRMHARPRLALRVAWDLVRIRFIHRGVRRAAAEAAATEAGAAAEAATEGATGASTAGSAAGGNAAGGKRRP